MALSFQAEAVLPLFLMFLGLSFSASALYVINDLLDLESDRAHAEKRKRPSASGELTVWVALASSAGIFVCSILLAYLASSWTGVGIVVIYAALSLVYTLKLKNLPLVDVTALSLLYVYRLVIGGLVSQVFVSYWLLAFAFFIFLSLAALKRVTELSALSEANDAVGTSIAKRGYLPTDTDLVKSVGIAFAVGSVGLLAIYIEASFESVSGTQVLPFLLVPLAAVWIVGLWLDQQRGTMGHDPVRHAYKDKRSLLLLTSMLLVYVMGRLG
jgi:4-hydroxybenzoate polyprenyltransferase